MKTSKKAKKGEKLFNRRLKEEEEEKIKTSKKAKNGEKIMERFQPLKELVDACTVPYEKSRFLESVHSLFANKKNDEKTKLDKDSGAFKHRRHNQPNAWSGIQGGRRHESVCQGPERLSETASARHATSCKANDAQLASQAICRVRHDEGGSSVLSSKRPQRSARQPAANSRSSSYLFAEET